MNIINTNDYICVAILALCEYPAALLAFTHSVQQCLLHLHGYSLPLCPPFLLHMLVALLPIYLLKFLSFFWF